MKIDYRWSVAKEGYLPILTSFFVCWLGTAFFGLSIVSIILFILFLIILYFFRDPDRIIPNEEGILSPADGKIISIEKSKDSEFTENYKFELARDPLFFTYSILVIIAGVVIIGFSAVFSAKKPKGF